MQTENKELLANETLNNPNAKVLIYAMQHIGYDNYVALCDIIDNSIDANATMIRIYVTKKDNKFVITIVDNGNGMSYEVLDEALKLGSDTEHDDFSDLGKYGMGLSTAGLSLADKTTVITTTNINEGVLKSETDVNVIKERNAFVKVLGDASLEEIAYFKNELGEDGKGTIVILQECSGVTNNNVTQFKNKLIKEISRKYRKFMDTITFYVGVNKEECRPVLPSDPLMLTGEDEQYTSEIYSDEDYTIEWQDSIGKHSNIIHAKLVLLPDMSREEAIKREINMANQGFSILRNNREIAFGIMPWSVKHNAMNRVRGEISFDSSMDEAMGVNFTKNNIDMIDSINNSLKHKLEPQIRAMRNKVQVSREATEEENVTHIEAETHINRKSKVLQTPPVKKEKRESPHREKSLDNPREKEKGVNEDGLRKIRIPKKYQGANANVRFILSHYSSNGPIFQAEQQGKTIIIHWNVDHPFYDRFVRNQIDNKSLITAVDYFVYSLAAAQIQAIGDDDDKAQMIDSVINTLSTNMKILLS